MKNFLVFLLIISFIAPAAFASEIDLLQMAQNETNKSNQVNPEEAITNAINPAKPKPKLVPKSHIVEDYLPILGRKMREQGMTPPKPFFLTLLYYYMEIPQNIKDAKGWAASTKGDNALFAQVAPNEANGIGVQMANAKVYTNSVGFRGGVNLFPFMSVFGVYMYTKGYSTFDAYAAPGYYPNDKGVYFDGFELSQKMKFEAHTGAIGATLQYGFRLGRVLPFGVVNVNYAWSKPDRTDQIIETIIGGARVGLVVPLPKQMRIAFTLGTQYQHMNNDKVSGVFPVTIPAGSIRNKDTYAVINNHDLKINARYSADAKYASPWVMNAGMSFGITRYFDLFLEFGFLSRFTSMVGAQANF